MSWISSNICFFPSTQKACYPIIDLHLAKPLIVPQRKLSQRSQRDEKKKVIRMIQFQSKRMDVVLLCPAHLSTYFHSYIGFSRYSISQYQPVNTWKVRCGIQSDTEQLCCRPAWAEAHAQGTEGPEQSRALQAWPGGPGRSRVCLGHLLGMGSVNRNPIVLSNRPSNVPSHKTFARCIYLSECLKKSWAI